MTTFWLPSRVLVRHIPYDTQEIRYPDEYGDVILKPVIVGDVVQGVDPTQHDGFGLGGRSALNLGIKVQAAVERVTKSVERHLEDADLVADPEHCELSLRVYGRVKAWPAVPGITTAAEEDQE